jgi:hypothetical protein
MRPTTLALAALLLATPAAAFVTTNGLVVRPTGGSDFTIPFRGLSGAPDFWCAAGDYVMRGLGRPGNTRVFRTSPGPRRSGQGMSFSLNPALAVDPGVAVLGSPDRGLSAASARQFCGNNRRFRD